MLKELRPAVLIFLALTLLTGVIYPLFVTGVANVLFTDQAHGSLIRLNGKVIGSELIGQSFDDPKYFWGRLSATSPAYNAASSSGSNYGPLNAALKDAVTARIKALKDADPSNASPIPIDLVTASGSGLDPHISPAAAYYQASRIARARKLPEETVSKIINKSREDRFLGLVGEPVVSVLKMNLLLDFEEQQIHFPQSGEKDELPTFMKWGVNQTK